MLKINRVVQVKIDDEPLVDGLRIIFRVERLIGDSFATLVLQIYNLQNISSSLDENSAIKEDSKIELIAGYKAGTATLFIGPVRNVETFREVADRITIIYANDGMKINDPIVNLTVSNPRNLSTLFSDIAKNVGIEVADINIEDENIEGSVTFNDKFSTVMRSLTKKRKIFSHIYNQQLYIYSSGRTKTPKHIISAATGLLEPPILTSKGINVKMLLEPAIKNGDHYEVLSGGVQAAQGNLVFRELLSNGTGDQSVLSSAHIGDTHGNTFFTELIGLRI